MTSFLPHVTQRQTSRQLNVRHKSPADDVIIATSLSDFARCDDTGASWPNYADNTENNDDQIVTFLSEFQKVIVANVKAGRVDINSQIEVSGNASPAGCAILSTVEHVKFTPTELDALYVEALYTIKHRIGRWTADGHGLSDNDLYNYVQTAFKITPEEHTRLMNKASQEKSPVVVLEVTVVEAKDLEAKDANGFSDPYCMLGIVTSSSPPPHHNNDVNKSTTNAAAEKNAGTAVGKKKTAVSAVEVIPARFIKTTSVKNSTLNPVWNEKFRFDIADVQTDFLHLDIWDHDDDTSVADAARRLNQVKGLKGLGRYFKQIAQSARHPTDESNPATETLDDFLGTVDVPIADIPSTGMDVWLDLKARSARSKVEGRIHLKLSLATREDRGLPEDERQFETKQHSDLMLVFIGHEQRRAKECGDVWNGQLPPAANAILHQHAVQGDITDAQHSICWWMALCRKFCEQSFDWSTLVNCLDDLDAKWNPRDVYKEEEFAIADYFDVFIQLCMNILSYKLMTSHVTWTDEKLQEMLSCLKRLYDSKLFKHCCAFKRDLRSEIINTVKNATFGYYQRLQKARRSKSSSNEDLECLVNGYVDMLEKINACLNVAKQIYNPALQRVAEIDYSSIFYRKIHALLVADICTDLNDLKQLVSETPLDDGFTVCDEMQSVRPVLRLFIALKNFNDLKALLSPEDYSRLGPFDYINIFTYHFERWLAVFQHFSTLRVKNTVEMDEVKEVCNANGDVKLSWSSYDTAYMFFRVIGVWQRLLLSSEPNDVSKRIMLLVVQTLCDVAVMYADLSHAKLKAAGYYDEIGQFDITAQLCIVFNNIEQVRRALASVQTKVTFEDNPPDVVGSSNNRSYETLRTTLSNANKTIEAKIQLVADHVADKMRPDIKRFVFHLCWAPEKALSEDVIGELMNYLDSNLITLNDNLFQANFERVLSSIWVEVLEEFDEVLSRPDEELRETTWITSRMQESLRILYEFVHADGKGLATTRICCPLYRDLHKQLELIQTPTKQLLQEYFAVKLKQQEHTKESPFGTLTTRVYYNHKAKLLTVEVVNARNLLPQDANGLSDPYITVELQPSHLFPGTKTHQTKVIKKTLNPTFNESFSFEVSEAVCNQQGACALLSVMDHDVVSANDFAGEVFVSLSTGSHGHDKQKSLTPISLPIMNPLAAAAANAGEGHSTSAANNARSKTYRRRGLLSALAMKYNEPSTLQFVCQRRTVDVE